MIYFITANPGKFRELKLLLPQIEQLKLGLDEIQSLDPKVVIRHKLAQAASLHDGEFIVDDTTFSMKCLGGLPGTLIKWFEEAIGAEGLAALAMKHEDRSATAAATLGYQDAYGQAHFFTGEVEGTVVPPIGDNGFGFDAIFQPSASERVYAQMSVEEKAKISHRGIAARKLADFLQKT